MSADFNADFPELSPRARTRNRLWGAWFGIVAALPLACWFHGFTVDDALISARVASHLARGLGPRFNHHGPLVDAVTPLGYAHFLAFFGRTNALDTFHWAQWLGFGAWLAAAAVLGVEIADSGMRARRFLPLALVALSVPLATWSVSGMETALVTLLCTLGLLDGIGFALALGFAAAWRPELVPFAFGLLSARSLHVRDKALRTTLRFALAALPVLLVATVRKLDFGRWVPLAFYAKPSDFAHGLQYTLGACFFTALPLMLVIWPRTSNSLPPRAKPLFWALAAHFTALVLCGGDWMPFYRLAVPALPCVALLAAFIAERASWRASLARASLAGVFALILFFGLGAPARRVAADREALIAEARPAFANDSRIASVDVGWVGVAASDAEVIDLAGVTDAEVAFFPGGHTSKRIPRAWLVERAPSAIVLLLARGEKIAPLRELRFSRAVEARVAELVAGSFRVRRTLALGDQTYVVLEPDPSAR